MKFHSNIFGSIPHLKFVDRNGNVNLDRDPERNRETHHVNNNGANKIRDDRTPRDRGVITRRILELCLSEILGTYMLMFFGCMSLISGFYQAPIPPLQSALVFGFVVSSVIVSFGHIAGAHLNPSVTMAALVLGEISMVDAVFFVTAQCIGCILGYASLGVVTPHDILTFGVSPDMGLCATIPHASLSDIQALLIEFLCTSFLVFTCCGVWDHRNAHQTDSIPIKFALVISLCSLTVGPYTGASMNPARSLAPAFVNNVWTKLWIYWVAPLLAGLLTPLLYMYAFERKRLEKTKKTTLTDEMSASAAKK